MNEFTAACVKSFLIAALLWTVTVPVQADPIVCNPKVAIANEGKSVGSTWVESLFASPDKPQPFSGAVQDDPDPDCSLASVPRPFASEPQRRQNRRARFN